MKITTDITELNKRQSQALYVKTEDSGRTIEITIQQNGNIYDITDKTIYFYATKPDNTKIQIEEGLTVKDAVNGIVEVTLPDQSLSVSGILKCEVVVGDETGLKLATATFNVNVITSINDDNAIISSNEYNSLIKRMADLDQQMLDQAQEFNNNVAARAATFQNNVTTRNNTFDNNVISRNNSFDDNVISRNDTFSANEQARQNTFDNNLAARETTFNNKITEYDSVFNQAETTRQENETYRQNRFAEIETEFATMVDQADLPGAYFTDLLENTSSLFSVGTGIDTGGANIDVSNNVVKGQVSDVRLLGNTRTNLLYENQASVETDTTGFSATAGATISKDTTEKLFGSSSLKTVVTSGSAFRGFTTDEIDVNPSKTYTASIYLKGTGTVNFVFRELDTNGNTVLSNNSGTIILTNSWQRFSLTKLFGATSVKAKLLVYTNTDQAITFYTDGLMIEETDTLKGWISGTKSTVSGELVSKSSDGTQESRMSYKLPEGQELRSLPNGINDKVRGGEGKIIQNVSGEIILNGTENWVEHSSIAGLFIGTNIPKLIGSVTTTDIALNCNILTPVGYYPKNNNEISLGGTNTPDRVFIKLDAYIGNLEGFKNWLSTNLPTLTYQLAEPIEYLDGDDSGFEIDGMLESFGPGTTIEFIPSTTDSTIPTTYHKVALNKSATIQQNTSMAFKNNAHAERIEDKLAASIIDLLTTISNQQTEIDDLKNRVATLEGYHV